MSTITKTKQAQDLRAKDKIQIGGNTFTIKKIIKFNYVLGIDEHVEVFFEEGSSWKLDLDQKFNILS